MKIIIAVIALIVCVYSLKCDFKEKENSDKFAEISQMCLRRMQRGNGYGATSSRGSGRGGGGSEQGRRNVHEFEYDEDGDENDSNESTYGRRSNGDRGSSGGRMQNSGREILRVKRQQHQQNAGGDGSGNGQRNDHERRDKLPDKTKIKQLLTKYVQNNQLKDFIDDSIAECFHLLELNQRREKCEFSQNLVTCLTDRAQANCDNWDRKNNVFF